MDLKNAEASNLLIKNGAKLITCAEDIIKDYSDIRQGGILNPFKLDLKLPVSMNQVLRELSVSCVTPSDSIFTPTVKRKERRAVNDKNENKTENKVGIPSPTSESEVMAAFSAEVFEIYKKIPTDSDCAIESLVDERLDLRRVMRALLKLEMGRFVVMLPGERVKRNL